MTITDRGEFTITGAIFDRGTYVDHGGYDTYVPCTAGPEPSGSPSARKGAGKSLGGTKAYAGLHGRGQEAGLYSFDTTDITMSGTVSGAPLELQAE